MKLSARLMRRAPSAKAAFLAFRRAPSCVALALTFTRLAPGSWIGAVAGDEIDTEVMKVAAERHRANRERIATWEGRVSVATSRQGTGHDGALRATGRFAWDRASGKLRWTWDGDSESPPSELDERGSTAGMLKDGAYYTLWRKEPADRATVFIAPAEDAKRDLPGWWNPVFNPEMWIDYHGVKLDEFVLAIRNDWEKLRSHPEMIYSLRRSGNIIAIDRRPRPNAGFFAAQTEEVDLSQGGNLVRFYNEGDNGLENWRWQWEEVNGVWVPKQIDIVSKKRPSRFKREPMSSRKTA